MSKKHPPIDRNFDDLTHRFKKNIYQTMKGKLRLAVLKRDLAEHLDPGQNLSVLDVGAGQGHWALEMARMGHCVLLSDVSAAMLEESRALFASSDLSEAQKEATAWLHAPMHLLPDQLNQSFDMVMCHAVLEWLAEPQQALNYLTPLVKPNGWLSLIFYNVDGLIFKNLLRTNYKKVRSEDFSGARGSLTPLNPLRSEQVMAWLATANLEVVCHSGIRVFHDYILDTEARALDSEQVMEMELLYSRRPPFRDLGRYIHLLCRKSA